MDDYERWETTVPEEIRGDILWKMRVYRLALFAVDIGWLDVTTLGRDHRTRSLSDQLYRALGSISANIAEGYSRGSGKDRARFFEYALGSARESRDWYYKGRHVLGDEVARQRMSLQVQIIKLLLTILPDERQRVLKEDTLPYTWDEEPTE